MTQLTVLRQRCTFSETEVYIDVYKGSDNFVTSDATLLFDLALQKTYRAIDSVVTGIKTFFVLCTSVVCCYYKYTYLLDNVTIMWLL